jgi:hypothetical protein
MKHGKPAHEPCEAWLSQHWEIEEVKASAEVTAGQIEPGDVDGDREGGPA